MIIRKRDSQLFAAFILAPIIALSMIRTFLKIKRDITMPNPDMYE